MQDEDTLRPLLARCVVCRGDIFDGDPLEIWEGGYYCERHSLAYLRERARAFADLISRGTEPEPLTD
ncbi:MAG TPA: hypothetical protein VFB58_00040 [Chloroflexota bacterium]|nr:hypothetical protein [Chloroflexota bacterium]